MKLTLGNQQTREHILSLITIIVLFIILSVLLASGKPYPKKPQTSNSFFNTSTTTGVDNSNDTMAKQNDS